MQVSILFQEKAKWSDSVGCTSIQIEKKVTETWVKPTAQDGKSVPKFMETVSVSFSYFNSNFTSAKQNHT